MKALAALVIAVGTTVVGVPAWAADLPVKAVTAPSPFVARWSGFYVGGNIGYGWGPSRSVTFDPNDITAFAGTCGGSFGGTCAQPAAYNVNGAIAGGQIGYNWQVNRNWLLGLETDFQWSGIDGNGTSPPFRLGTGAAGPASSFDVSEKLRWFGTVRARLGWLPSDNFLVYATGGLAYGSVVRSATLNSVAGTNLAGGGIGYNCVAGPACFVGSKSKTSVGWTAGAGIEYALWSNWRVKAEYLYVRLSGDSVVTTAVATLTTNRSSFTANFSNADFHIARLGLNYQFGAAVLP